MQSNYFLQRPAVSYPDLDNLATSPLRLYVDWSSKAISGNLCQIQTDPSTNITCERLIGSIGRKCNSALQNAGSTKGESAALLLATQKFRHFLILDLFLCFSDNLSLYWLSNLRNLSGHYHRLFQQLSEFSFFLYQLSSRDNRISDLISRSDMPPLTAEEEHLLADDLPTPTPDNLEQVELGPPIASFKHTALSHLPSLTPQEIDFISTLDTLPPNTSSEIMQVHFNHIAHNSQIHNASAATPPPSLHRFTIGDFNSIEKHLHFANANAKQLA